SITAYCEEEEVDLLVIGDRVSGIVQTAIFGSTASYLLRASPAPILVVKTEPERPYRDILIAVDFSPASVRSVHLAQTLAPDARLHLLHVSTYPLESLMRYADATEASINAYRRRAEIRARSGLEELAKDAGLGTEHMIRTV